MAASSGLVRPPWLSASTVQTAGRRHPTSRRIVLRARAAAGLAAVVDSGGPVTARTRRCDRPGRLLPYPQILVFVYQCGPPSG